METGQKIDSPFFSAPRTHQVIQVPIIAEQAAVYDQQKAPTEEGHEEVLWKPPPTEA